MADNLPATPGSGATIAFDDISGVMYQRVKIGVGEDGAATDVSEAAPIPVLHRVTTATLANVSASATSVTLFSSNASARGRMVVNDSQYDCYVKFGTTASTTSYTVKLGAGGYYEFPEPVYTGRVDAIWTAASGAARTTETA